MCCFNLFYIGGIFNFLLSEVEMNMENKIKGSLYGAIVGDALGVPVEFIGRYARDKSPVEGMIGNGTYNQPAGTWSDDSSMLLGLVDAINRGFSYDKVADNFKRWYKYSKFTPHGEVFDIGNTTRLAISNICSGMDPVKCGPTDESCCGNGSLMRIIPLSFYNLHKDEGEMLDLIENVSSITHGNKICKLGCIIYVKYARDLIRGYEREEALDNTIEFVKSNCWDKNGGKYTTKELMKFNRILCKDVCILERDEVKSSGYVIDTLEAAIWCVLTSTNFKNTVLKAVNLGDDTDTVACVTGGLAGIIYGYDAIPSEWLDVLARKDWLDEKINKFVQVTLNER